MNLKSSSLITLLAFVTGVNIHLQTKANATSLDDFSTPIQSQTNKSKSQDIKQLAGKNPTKSPLRKTKKNAQFNCDEALTQVEINQCTVNESAHTEKQLKKIYHQLKTQNSGNVEQLNLLKQTQSLWLKYRETSCQFASSQYEGGSIQPFIYSSCITGLTKERVENLETYLLP